MAPNDPFEPKLGKVRAQRPKMPKSFRSKVLHAVQRAGGLKPGTGRSAKSAFAASKFGRGNGVARIVSSSASGGKRGRRVAVKSRSVRFAGKGLQAAMAHVKYIQREGVTREGTPGQMYGPGSDREDGQAFMKRAEGDRHQFRFIVAPENGDRYDDLKPLTRKLMSQMETDLGTKLDWVAVDHFNTGHPHTHIVVRGKADDGKDLVIAREYLTEGLRHRAEAIVTLDLGPRSDFEISAERQAEVSLSRFTSIDRHLLRDADQSGRVSAMHSDPAAQALRAGRLAKLQDFGLAESEGNGQWRLRPDMEDTLRQMGRKGDIIRTMYEALRSRGMESTVADSVIHDRERSSEVVAKPVTGRLLTRGLADDDGDRHFVLIEATDGRIHYIDVGQGDRVEPLGQNAIVRVTPKMPNLRVADHTIVEVAGQNGGHYDIEAHLKHEPSASQAFAQTHVRRLEAIRKVTNGVEREPDGRFKIGADYLDRALAYEKREARISPVRIDVLSNLSLDGQTKRQGVTWLDHELVAGESQNYADNGFGKDSRAALQRRQQWLLSEGLATQGKDGQIVVAPRLLETLHHREIHAVVEALTRATGLGFTETRSGEFVEGKLRQSITLGSGKFAVIERARDFTLVPWRPVLEKHIGKEVSGLMRESGINWSIGRNRGPTIE